MRVVDRSHGIYPNAPRSKVKQLKLQELPPDRRTQAGRHLPIYSAFLESQLNEEFMSADSDPYLSELYAVAPRDERQVDGEAGAAAGNETFGRRPQENESPEQEREDALFQNHARPEDEAVDVVREDSVNGSDLVEERELGLGFSPRLRSTKRW